MKCCGEERATCFCPDCGKKLNDGKTLIGLLSHLYRSINRYKTLVKKGKQNGFDTEANERSLGKFQAWADEVGRVIAEADAKGA